MITSLLYNLQIDFCLQHEDYTIVPVSGRSGLVLWDDPEGWDGEWGGRVVQDGEHMYTHGWFMSMYGKATKYCKVISLQLK